MPAYEFHYTPDEGALAGLTFEQQTEDAINDLGNNAYNAGTNAAEALEQATAAAKAATEAKNLANSAQTTADNAQTTATNAGTAAKAAQDTADAAKASAATNAANIATNAANIATNAAGIAKNAANIETLLATSGTASTDLTELKTAVQTNTNNISTLFDAYKDLITFDDASNVTDADLVEDYGIYEVSGATVANLPKSHDTFVFEARQNTAGTAPRIFQTAIDEADGALYVRVGEMADSGTTWGAWTSSRVDVSKYAPIDSPALTGTPTAPTATAGTSTEQIANTAFVVSELEAKVAVLEEKVNSAIAAVLLTGNIVDDSTSVLSEYPVITSIKATKCEKVTERAFQNRTLLTSLDLPACTSIGDSAFNCCTSLASFDLPACTSIGDSAFQSCTSLTSLDLPGCTSIGDSAFNDCTSLASFDLPACTSIGNYAFNCCTSLTSLDLPACTSIGGYAFQSCTSLTSVNLPVCEKVGNNSYYEGRGTFYGCSQLTIIDLPVCTLVGTNSFNESSSLTALILRSPTICKSVGSQSFSNSALKIYVPEALLDEYKAASYWSSWADRFASLEEYEANAVNAISLDDDGISTLELEDTQISVDELIAAAENDIKTAQTLGDPTDYIEERLKELYAERDEL